MKTTALWLNGQKIETFPSSWGVNRAFLFGESVFSTLKIVDGQPSFLEEHLDRLSAHFLNFYFLKVDHQLKRDIQKRIKNDLKKVAMNYPVGKMRITLFYEDADFRLDNFLCLISIDEYEEDFSAVRAKSHSIMGNPLRAYKLGSYSHLFYLRRSLENAFNDICLIDEEQQILELITSNLFFIKDKVLYWPKYNQKFLAGITMKNAKKAFEKSYEICEDSIYLKDLADFDQAYCCNSLNCIRPISQIDQYDFENSCFEKLLKLWFEYDKK